MAKTLILGCGNPTRGDDGLAPLLIERLQAAKLPWLEARYDYQLRVEDAMQLGDYKLIIFVDADRSCQAPYEYTPVDMGSLPVTLDTHHTSPQALMQLSRSLFGIGTPGMILAIRGYEFEPFVEKLSTQANSNLEQACEFLLGRLSDN